MALSYEQAQKVIAGAAAKADEMGMKMAIAVTDEEGHVVALARMGGRGPTGEVALGKAMVSAIFGAPSHAMAERYGQSIGVPLTLMHGGRLIFAQGAVPLKLGDEVVGGVGVSGSKPSDDEMVAQAGADAP